MISSRHRYRLIFLVFVWIFLSLGCGSNQDEQDEIQALSGNYHPAVEKWSQIFSPSVLTLEQRQNELAWFRKTSNPFRGLSIKSVSEDIETSFWESQFLARAFKELTGIEVHHDVIGEGHVVEKLMEQLEKGTYHYDIYVSDADLIGTHLRMKKIVVLSDYMKAEGATYTNPLLDLNDFLNLEFGQDYDGNQLQIPNYQFALVYWFRQDWFSDPDIQKEFEKRFGYKLGVPLNWSAYQDIAEFFSGKKMKNANDSVVTAYGHADYGLPGPWLGWRFSDAFMSIAGMGDKGLPNGMPVDEWGIRVEDRVPVGASVERGGAINSPAAIYALTTWIDFLNNYAPPESLQLDWLNFGALPARGDIAQTWYWTYIYAALNPEYGKIGSPVCNKQGEPLWRIAPVPRGRYWEEGMKIGYQDAGSWTLPNDTIGAKRHASWLWAQFCMSKSVALKKFIAGVTPVRKSTLFSEYVSRNKDRYGGLIEFTRSSVLKNFTDSGPNVPHYPTLSKLWWENIAKAIKGEISAQQALDSLASQIDEKMAHLTMAAYSPDLNERSAYQYWLDQPGAPKPAIDQEPEPKTIQYADLIKQWVQ